VEPDVETIVEAEAETVLNLPNARCHGPYAIFCGPEEPLAGVEGYPVEQSVARGTGDKGTTERDVARKRNSCRRSAMLKTKSVYTPIDREGDGLRILVTRSRGRGMPTSRVDVWMPTLGPSENLLRVA
jgi:hypothetical protein